MGNGSSAYKILRFKSLTVVHATSCDDEPKRSEFYRNLNQCVETCSESLTTNEISTELDATEQEFSNTLRH